MCQACEFTKLFAHGVKVTLVKVLEILSYIGMNMKHMKDNTGDVFH